MENEFAKVMSERTDEELITIVTADRANYNEIAIEAADLEVTKRNIDTSKFEEIKEKVTTKKAQKQKVDSNVVNSGIRFVNFLIDIIVWSLCVLIIAFLLEIFIDISQNGLINLLIYVLYFGTFIARLWKFNFKRPLGNLSPKLRL